jgi:hypothetical protein
MELPSWGEYKGLSRVEAQRAEWRDYALLQEYRTDYLRLCRQWNRLVVLSPEVEQLPLWQQYWCRLYEGLRVENLLRRYVYDQAPYRRGFADYVRYRYALSHPTEIDPRCWVDPTLWDEARRGGYCMLAGNKITYCDGHGVRALSQPPASPVVGAAVAAVTTEKPPVPTTNLWAAAPQFVYPPYYYRPVGGALECGRSQLSVR